MQLVCVNHGSFADAVKVVMYCRRQMLFESITILHPDPWDSTDEIRTVKCSKKPEEAWVHEVPKIVESDRVMSVHWDGYMVNPLAWTDEFMKYDWIGAPWPLDNLVRPEWRVGNGGFSIFSKAMAKAWEKMADTERNHDWQICALDRGRYEAEGLTFAPFDLAFRFSTECPLPDFPIKEYPFGFHDLKRNPQHRKLVYG